MRVSASEECLPSWRKGTGPKRLLTQSCPSTNDPLPTHIHPLPCSIYGLEPTTGNSVLCFSWPGCPSARGRGFREGKQPQGLLKQGNSSKSPLQVIAAIPLLLDNTLPFVMVLHLKSLLSQEVYQPPPLTDSEALSHCLSEGSSTEQKSFSLRLRLWECL